MKTKSISLAMFVAGVLAIVGLTTATTANVVHSASPGTPSSDELYSTCLGSSATRTAFHPETGVLRFVGTEIGNPIRQPLRLPASASSADAARAYLSVCGPLFGLQDQEHQLSIMSETFGDRGHSFVRFQQVHQGIPVMGGEIIVQMDAQKNIVSVNGEILPDLQMDVAPRTSAEIAKQRALEKVAKDYELDTHALVATEPELWIHNPTILGGPGPRLSRLVWRLEVYPVELLPIRELVLVDAQTGAVVLHFNQIDTALYRKIYDNQNVRSDVLQNPANLRRSEGNPPTGITDVDRAYDYAGDTYNFYWDNHNRDSIDGAGMQLIHTVRFCPSSTSDPCPYPNAFWNGSQMVYGEGFVVDDVVAHEMTHGVTYYASHLFYYYQSGAINEAFSDIWGEFIDLTNGRGNDAPEVRWLLGEDLSIGAIRSMSNPPAYNDPDKMTSSYYHCAESDKGGVHTNSGVGNKAAYLIVDGGTFNGKTVVGIGITKAAKIFYEAQAHLLTSASDYEDLYYALQQACTNLIGTGDITAADCQQVRNALDAVEMNLQPPGCSAPHAPLCDAGKIPHYLFFDDLENPASGRWASSANIGANQWYYPPNANPYNFDATYATSGVYNFWGYDQSARGDYFIYMTSDVALPAGSTPYMHFNHAYGFDNYGTTLYDGGVVEYSTDGGSTWNDAGSLFVNNGYRGTLSSSWGNPLGGRQAFGGQSNGYISSRLSLSPLAGQNVRFRFRIGTDSSADDYGWFIDDIRIYTCVEPGRVFLPFAPRNCIPPTPTTPTPTPTPGGPTPSPTPSGPVDGNWCGSNCSFSVTNNGTRISTFSLTINWGGTCGVAYTIDYFYNIPISNNSFSVTETNRTLRGNFTSATTASGTYWKRLEIPYPPCSATRSGSWSASPCSTPTPTPGGPTLSPTPTPTAPTPTPTPGGPTPTPSPTPTPTPPSGWQTIIYEDFEGTFPGLWDVFDDYPGYGEYYWGKRTCRPYQGSYSGWGVGGGANGSSLSCGSNYPNYTEGWMVYGPFSLVGASDADLTFKLWLNSELNYDFVCRMASINGTDFYGYCTSGSANWIDRELDLTNVPTLGNLLGQPQVWIALVFSSDSSINYPEGGYVDNILLRKCIGTCTGGNAIPTPGPDSLQERLASFHLPTTGQ